MLTALGRRVLLLAALLSTLLSTAGCTTTNDNGSPDPQTVLSDAAEKIGGTSGLKIELDSEDFPEDVSGLISARGVVLNPNSFDGELTIRISGGDFPVPVIGVGDTILAEIPLTEGWSDVTPADYGAPDPTTFLSEEIGFASLLPVTTQVEVGESVRGGSNNEEVLTSYSGVVPGEQMDKVIPSSSGTEFEVEYLITEEGELREASFTGVFYPDTDSMTYHAEFTEYNTEATVTLPAVDG
jgi:lipoprotein LprG